jgi:hypothetical protein
MASNNHKLNKLTSNSDQGEALIDLCAEYIQRRLQNAAPGQAEAVRMAGKLIFSRYLQEKGLQH